MVNLNYQTDEIFQGETFTSELPSGSRLYARIYGTENPEEFLMFRLDSDDVCYVEVGIDGTYFSIVEPEA